MSTYLILSIDGHFDDVEISTSSVYHLCHSMTWLKKKIKQLGLHRRGDLVSYTPVTVVTRAIMV